MKWFIRGLYFFLVAFYTYALIDHFAYLPFNSLMIVKWIITSAIWNSGVFLITLDFFKKRKILGFFIFLPTLITSPLLLPFKYGVFHWGCLILMLVIIVIFVRRKYEDMATIT